MIRIVPIVDIISRGGQSRAGILAKPALAISKSADGET
jgi:hypothetical protein